MRKIEEIGICPECYCSLTSYKTESYKRFAKCDICGMSYPLPKSGKLNNSALICPKKELPVLIVYKPNQRAYFWTDSPCFSCIKYDKCEIVKDLTSEFTELQVYGY
ncbi:MAG: hypothetical protein ACFFCI_07915 [Promethearchaeota archaeon]